MSSMNLVRLPDGTELNASQWLHWPMYSVIEAAAADAINLLAFSYGVGQDVAHTPTIARRTATDLDTNILRRRKMGQDEALVVHAVTYEIFALTSVTGGSPVLNVALVPAMFATDIVRLQRSCVVDLNVGADIKKPQVGVTFSYIPQAIGAPAYISGDEGVNPAVSWHYGTGGEITPRAQRVLNLPVYIGGFGENAKPGNTMYFSLRFWAPGGPVNGLIQNFSIRWWLDALKKRPA